MNRLDKSRNDYDDWQAAGFALERQRGQAESRVGALRGKLRNAPELDTPGRIAIAEKQLRDAEVAIARHAMLGDGLAYEVRSWRRRKVADLEYQRENAWRVAKWGGTPSKIQKSAEALQLAFGGDYPPGVGEHIGALRNWGIRMTNMSAELKRINNEGWD